jgi:hypothetical protein
MARPDEKEDEEIAKPGARRKRLASKEKKHQQKANDEAQERGVNESSVAKRRVIRDPEIIQKRIHVRQDSSGDCNRPIAARGAIRGESNAQGCPCRSMGDDRSHIKKSSPKTLGVRQSGMRFYSS